MHHGFVFDFMKKGIYHIIIFVSFYVFNKYKSIDKNQLT